MKKINEDELKEIFEKIRSGDKNAIELLYANYHSLVYGVAFSILKNKDNSEDIVQNVFAKILKLDKEKLPTQGEASWLYTVSKNETIQFLRKQKQIVDIDDLYSLESESDEINDIVDMASYYKLLENLTPQDREIISLRILSDFTFDKIAQMLDMPIGTVEWRYYKALHFIKLSITNLAAVLIVFTAWKISQIPFEKEFTSESTNTIKNETTTPAENRNETNSHGYSYYDIEVDTVLEAATDYSYSSSSSNKIFSTLFALTTFIICTIFVVFAIFWAFKKKIKIKK